MKDEVDIYSENPYDPKIDYNHWRACHEALDNCLSEHYLQIKDTEDLEELSHKLLGIADTYHFTGAKIYIKSMLKRARNIEPKAFQEGLTDIIYEFDEKIEQKIRERKGAAKRGLMENVPIRSYPPFEIHDGPWGEDVYCYQKRIDYDMYDTSIVNPQANRQWKKLLLSFVKKQGHTLPISEISSTLCCTPHAAETAVSDLRQILRDFERKTSITIEIPRKYKGEEYYKLVVKTQQK